MSDRIYPPRKKDWKPGDWQIGLFVRLPDNSQVVSVWDCAPDVIHELAMKMLLERFPDVKSYLDEQAKIRPARILPDLGEEEEDGQKR